MDVAFGEIFMLAYLWVAIGGALGSVGRYWVSGFVAERFGETFPWGTILINLTGSFIIGAFAAFTDPDGRVLATPGFRQFFMFGICGGYTTFSSFSLQTLRLAQDRQWLYAGGNVILSVALCLVAVWLGYWLGSMFNSAK
jgi:CrcB protein